MKKVSLIVLFCMCLLLSGCGPTSPAPYTVSGRVTLTAGSGGSVEDVTLLFSGYGIANPDADGRWSKDGLKGAVTVTPAMEGWIFEPDSRQVTGRVDDIDFTGSVESVQTRTVLGMAAGFHHSLALMSDGSVWACGHNEYRQLGDGSTAVCKSSPVRVLGLEGPAVSIAAGADHNLALMGDGTVWAWGSNGYGQSGGEVGTQALPLQVSGLVGAVALSGGRHHSLALKADGTVWTWGQTVYHPIGCPTYTYTDRLPVQVSELADVTAIACGWYHDLALKSDGTVWAWGSNGSGRLGDGTSTYRTAPVQVSGLEGIVAISAGDSHSMALKDDGTVWAWGGNDDGQLGDGTTTGRYTPTRVGSLEGVAAISTGRFHNIALCDDGTVRAWGKNDYGQLGDGTTANRYNPVQVSGFAGIEKVAAGALHTVAVHNDGTAWACGANTFGSLGDGTTTARRSPVRVFQF